MIVYVDDLELLKSFSFSLADRRRNRYYYASASPRFILRVDRIRLEQIERGYYEARVTLDERTHRQYVCAGNEDCLHTAVTLRRKVDTLDPSAEHTTLSALWHYACARDGVGEK